MPTRFAWIPLAMKRTIGAQAAAATPAPANSTKCAQLDRNQIASSKQTPLIQRFSAMGLNAKLLPGNQATALALQDAAPCPTTSASHSTIASETAITTTSSRLSKSTCAMASNALQTLSALQVAASMESAVKTSTAQLHQTLIVTRVATR